MHVLPPGYLKALKTHCDKRGMLLIVDEAQTGIARCGALFPIPLSAVVTSNEIERICTERDYCFYTTHVNDPLPASVGDKVLEIVLRDNLVENSRRMGALLREGLIKLQKQYKCIGDVRGRGLMYGGES